MRLVNLLGAVSFFCALVAAIALPGVDSTLGLLQGRQIITGLQCVLAGLNSLAADLLLQPGGPAYCQTLLGYAPVVVVSTTSTISTTTITTYIAQGTNSVQTIVTASPVTASPITGPIYTTTATGSTVYTTTCTNTPPGLARKRQAATVSVPSVLSGVSASIQSEICECAGVQTPTITSVSTQTSVVTSVLTVPVTATTTGTLSVTPTVTPTITPTTTVTYTPTSTITFCATPTVADNSCNNAGLQWAYWLNSSPTLNYAANNPEYLKTTAPAVNGTESPASQAGGFSGGCASNSDTYDQDGTQVPCNFFMMQWRGFVYCPIAGTYTFSFDTSIDDLAYIWVGNEQIEYTGYTGTNANVISRSPAAAAVTAAVGQYIPLRFAFAQATGPYAFGVTITAPDGSTVLDGNGNTANLIQFSCDGVAPNWLPWGNETSS